MGTSVDHSSQHQHWLRLARRCSAHQMCSPETGADGSIYTPLQIQRFLSPQPEELEIKGFNLDVNLEFNRAR